MTPDQNARTELAVLHLLKAVRELQDAVRLTVDIAAPNRPRGLLYTSPVDEKLFECGRSIEEAVNALTSDTDE